MFDKRYSKLLPKHQPYDLAIQMEEGSVPPLGPIYSLSALKLQTLREFIKDNIKIGSIQPSQSLGRALVLFVKKKNSNLRLCIDYWGLNKLTHKDHYPISLITDLLDTPKKARIYTKIDLRNAYHLVHIAKGNKWKTTFRTRYGSFKWLVMPLEPANASAAFQ